MVNISKNIWANIPMIHLLYTSIWWKSYEPMVMTNCMAKNKLSDFIMQSQSCFFKKKKNDNLSKIIDFCCIMLTQINFY